MVQEGLMKWNQGQLIIFLIVINIFARSAHLLQIVLES